MNMPFETLYFKHNELNNLQLIFYYRNGSSLLFNGYGFEKRQLNENELSSFSNIKQLTTGTAIDIRAFEDVYYVKLNSGAILQIFRMMSDENNAQQLVIFENSADRKAEYQLASDRFESADRIEH